MKEIISMLLVIFLLGCSNNFENDQLKSSYKDKQTNYKQAEEKKEFTNNVKKKILDVPIINQNPELKYGCEVTSLTMVLQYAGYNVDKMTLANQLKKDTNRIVTENGDIVRWGDPNKGFVGDITGQEEGYAVFDKPLKKLMEKYLGEKTINLTGKEFDRLLKQIDNDKPVIIWTTGDYKMPDRWESWLDGRKKIKTPLDLHVVVLVGYDENNVYINDPLTSEKAKKVDKETFINSWEALKKRALSYN